MSKMYTWKMNVTVKVDATWVADGFEATALRMEEAIQGAILPYASDSEKVVLVKITQAPLNAHIRAEQGYEVEA